MNDKGSYLIKMVTSAIMFHHGDDILCNKSGKSSSSSMSDTIHAIIRKYERSKNSGWLLKRSLEEAKIANESFDKESRQNFIDCDRKNIFVLDVLEERIAHL